MLGSSSKKENSDDKIHTNHLSQHRDLLPIQPLQNIRKAKIDASSGLAWNDKDYFCDLWNESAMINMLQMPTHGNTKMKSRNKINNINNHEENNKHNKSESIHTM